MPVLKDMGILTLSISLRLRGAGYRRYSSKPEHFHPLYNKHWFRHVIVAFSPGGRKPLPFWVWLGFPDGFIPDCYVRGMVIQKLLEELAPDWSFMQRFVEDLEQRVSEDNMFMVEHTTLKYWLDACHRYCVWYLSVSLWYSASVEDLLDPPAVCFRPDRKDQLHKFHKYGRLFRMYDYVRTTKPPIPLSVLGDRSFKSDIVYVKLWLRANCWFSLL